MTPAQRDIARAGIAKMIPAKILYGTDVAPHATTSNWSTLNSFELILNLSIEGEEGYRPEITEQFCSVYRNFITYGWYESGAPYEGLGKNYQFNITMIPMAMRGYTEKPNDFQYQTQPESYYNVNYHNLAYWAGGENKVTGYVKRPHNPMEKVYRTVAMARGEYPFLLVVDDVKKDNNVHNYKWLAQIAADLSIESTDVNINFSNYRCDIILKEASGNRRLLVRVLQNNGYTSGAPGYLDQFTNFHNNVMDRLVIEANTVSPDFKVLIYPYEIGQPLPVTTYDSSNNRWSVNIGNQAHLVDLDDQNGKTLVDIIPVNTNSRMIYEEDTDPITTELLDISPLEKLSSQYALTTYPVPAYDKLHFNLNVPAATAAQVKIVDMQGRILYSKQAVLSQGDNNYSIDIQQHLVAATYLLVVDLGGDNVVVRQFIKGD